MPVSSAPRSDMRRLVQGSRQSRTLNLLLIPLFMTLFSLGGAIEKAADFRAKPKKWW